MERLRLDSRALTQRAPHFGRGKAAFGFEHGVRMIGGREAVERAQPVAESFGFRRRPALCPVGDRGIVAGAHRLEHRIGRTPYTISMAKY